MLFQMAIGALMAFGQDPAVAAGAPTATETAPVSVERIGFGAVWLGMSFDEARTALPDVAWQEKAAVGNPSRIRLSGPGAIDLFGRRFDVEIKPGVHGASRIDLHTAVPEIGLRGCRALVAEAVTGLEARFGRFEALPNTPATSGGELPAAIRMWTPRDLRMELPGSGFLRAGLPATEVFDAGDRSRVNFFTLPGYRRIGEWQSIRQPANDNLTIGVGAGYAPDLDTAKPTCDLYIFASYEPPRPERETIAFEDLVPVRTPTIADRHASLRFMSAEQLASLPEEGVDISVDCIVERQYGTLLCLNPDEIRPEERELILAAQSQGGTYVFRTDTLQPESEISLRTRLTVRLRASDRIDLSRLVDEPILPMREVRWTRFPNREWLAEQAEDLEPGDVSIKARCQLQSDGSVICADMAAERDGESYQSSGLESTGRQIVSLIQAASELSDGARSAGRWFDFKLTFRVAE